MLLKFVCFYMGIIPIAITWTVKQSHLLRCQLEAVFSTLFIWYFVQLISNAQMLKRILLSFGLHWRPEHMNSQPHIHVPTSWNSLWWVPWHYHLIVKPVCFCWCFRQPYQIASDLKWNRGKMLNTTFFFLAGSKWAFKLGPPIENPSSLNKHLVYPQILLQYSWTHCMIDI